MKNIEFLTLLYLVGTSPALTFSFKNDYDDDDKIALIK